MRSLDLFSGIGGLSLGLERAGIHAVVHCEIDEKCQRVLRNHWPETPLEPDVATIDVDGYSVDLVAGGFPCQPFSSVEDGTTSPTCGHTCCVSSNDFAGCAQCDPFGYWLRTSLVSVMTESIGSAPISSVRASPAGRSIWILRHPAGIAGADGSSSWPTPTAKANHDAPSMRKWPAYRKYQDAVKRTTPRLWEWMMGFPAGWTRCARSATASRRGRRK